MEAEWGKESESGPVMSKELLLIEHGLLGRKMLAYEISGRVIFSVSMLVETYLASIGVAVIPIILLLVVYAAFWISGMYVALQRSRFISTVIAESTYFGEKGQIDHEWNRQYIRVHQNRYEGRAGWLQAFMLIAEPVVWVTVATLIMLWISVRPFS